MLNIEFYADNKRYFKNPCADDPEKLAKFVDEEWLKNNIKTLTISLATKTIEQEECEEGGVYTGVGGIGYALLRVSLAFPETPKDYYLNLCSQLLNYQLVNAKNASKHRLSRYLTGTLGLYTVQALALHSSGAPFDAVVDLYRSLLSTILTSGYQKIGDDEIMNGRAGFLAGVLLLRMKTGQVVLTDAELRSVLKVMIASGHKYSQDNGSNARLMYQWHGSEYLGAAHGVSGIYQIFMSYWDLLTDGEKEDVLQSVDWYLTLQSPEGNFPSSSRHIGENRGDNELVHWCHGATGAIQMLITAYIVTNSNKYLESAKKCADIIWHKGILLKGPGICHGVSGNGYAFLFLYRLTNEVDYLNKAKVFAAIMMDKKFTELTRKPDSPDSLFEGWAGSLCFMTDLLNPTKPEFPMIPIIFPENS